MGDEELDQANLDEYMDTSSEESSDQDELEDDEFFNQDTKKSNKNKKRELLIASLDGNKNCYGDFKKKTNTDFTIVFKGGLESKFDSKDRKKMTDLVDKPKTKKSRNKLKKNDDVVLGKRDKEEIEIIADKEDLKAVLLFYIKILGIHTKFVG